MMTGLTVIRVGRLGRRKPMLKTEWGKPGTGRTVGELRRWIGGPGIRASGDLFLPRDDRYTALDIVRSGPPEPYDVERVEEAIRRVEVEGEALTQALDKLESARAAVNRMDDAKLKWAEAQADTQTAIALLDFTIGRRGERFERAREVFRGAKAAEEEAWRRWQACR